MSRTQDPHRPLLPFGSPFRLIFSRGSDLSPKLISILHSFELALAGRIKRLKPACREDVLSLSWMRCAMESLCGIHADIKALITALEFPVYDWDDRWIDLYLDNSVKLLDMCNAFSSEISRLKQGHLLLKFVLHNLGGDSSKPFVRICSSLDDWRQHFTSKNPRLDNCFSVMDGLVQTLDLPKSKNSAKGKVLMQAMYGVKVVTLLVCSMFATAFSGSMKKLVDMQVPETFLWAEVFTDLQTCVNTEIRSVCSSRRVMVLKELEAVDTCVKKLYPIVQGGVDHVEARFLQESTSELGKLGESFSEGLDMLAKEVNTFFQILLTGRDALLSNIRVGANDSNKVRAYKNVEGLMFR